MPSDPEFLSSRKSKGVSRVASASRTSHAVPRISLEAPPPQSGSNLKNTLIVIGVIMIILGYGYAGYIIYRRLSQIEENIKSTLREIEVSSQENPQFKPITNDEEDYELIDDRPLDSSQDRFDEVENDYNQEQDTADTIANDLEFSSADFEQDKISEDKFAALQMSQNAQQDLQQYIQQEPPQDDLSQELAELADLAELPENVPQEEVSQLLPEPLKKRGGGRRGPKPKSVTLALDPVTNTTHSNHDDTEEDIKIL